MYIPCSVYVYIQVEFVYVNWNHGKRGMHIPIKLWTCTAKVQVSWVQLSLVNYGHIIIVVSHVSPYGRLNITRNLGLHGHLPGI